MDVIEISGLRKSYRRRGGRTTALAGLDLAVPAGGVFGFLGPNGSGKTTTIRCLLGLARPTGGRATLFGRETPGHLPETIGSHRCARRRARRCSPRSLPAATCRSSARLAASARGASTEVLERVGLASRADDLVRTYSLGMRQRLGIGAALLADPELLILDEPANGLDPAGIKEIRELLRAARRRRAHRLRVEPSARRGAADLRPRRHHRPRPLRHRGARRRGAARRTIRRRCRSASRSTSGRGRSRCCARPAWTARADGTGLLVDVPATGTATITRALARHRLYLTELRPIEVSLEDVFLELTMAPAANGLETTR